MRKKSLLGILRDNVKENMQLLSLLLRLVPKKSIINFDGLKKSQLSSIDPLDCSSKWSDTPYIWGKTKRYAGNPN